MKPREGPPTRGARRAPRQDIPNSATDGQKPGRSGIESLPRLTRDELRQFVPDLLWPVYQRLLDEGLPAGRAVPFLLIALYFQWKALWTEPRWETLRARLLHDLEARIAALCDGGFPESAIGELPPLLELAGGPLIRRPTGGPRGGGRKGVPAERMRAAYAEVKPRLSTLWVGHRDADPQELERGFLHEWPELKPRWQALRDRLFVARRLTGWLHPVLAAKLGCSERTVAALLRRFDLPSRI